MYIYSIYTYVTDIITYVTVYIYIYTYDITVNGINLESFRTVMPSRKIGQIRKNIEQKT